MAGRPDPFRPARTLSPEDALDRLLIQDHIIGEAYALDERDWDAWEAHYTPDASIDWTEAGAIKGTPAAVRSWAAPLFATFPYPQYQHLTGNFQVRVTGDAATCRHMQYIAISLPSPGGTSDRRTPTSPPRESTLRTRLSRSSSDRQHPSGETYRRCPL